MSTLHPLGAGCCEVMSLLFGGISLRNEEDLCENDETRRSFINSDKARRVESFAAKSLNCSRKAIEE